ncbi:MAG: GEVED domain-containing protein [Planctomycetaceae bacterium]|nr:GEVED domain-containing protein [Planctomycetaceae bacterium]
MRFWNSVFGNSDNNDNHEQDGSNQQGRGTAKGFGRLFSQGTKAKGPLQTRKLQIDQLEAREMLSIGGPQLNSIFINQDQTRSLSDESTLHIAPTSFLLRFSEGATIDPASLGGIEVFRSGGDGVPGFSYNDREKVTIGYIGIGDFENEVIVRFAENLPSDLYQVRIVGGGDMSNPEDINNPTILKSVITLPNGTKEYESFYNRDGMDTDRQTVDFELQLGAKVASVVTQPTSRDAQGNLTQSRKTIEVYFNEAINLPADSTKLFQLFATQNTLNPDDDVMVYPTRVDYNPQTNCATLTFAKDLAEYGNGAFRLRLGEQYYPTETRTLDLINEQDKIGDTFRTAYHVDSGNFNTASNNPQSLIIHSQIERRYDPVEYPGASDDPGHRDLPYSFGFESEKHTGGNPEYDDRSDAEKTANAIRDTENGPTIIYYNFKDILGNNPKGGFFRNSISDAQKELARIIFDMYSRYLGIQFVETANMGITVATGDLAWLGGQSGGELKGRSDFAFGAVMDYNKNWGADVYGGTWFDTAMHEIGHCLGFNHTYDLTPGTPMGPGVEDNARSADGNGTLLNIEKTYPSLEDIIHGMHMYRPDSIDIDVYEFALEKGGTFSAEVFAQRASAASQLDVQLKIYQQVKKGDFVTYELVAQNDNYFGKDSFVEIYLPAGIYYVAVTSTGNDDINPQMNNTGGGGRTVGNYELRLNFSANGVDRNNPATFKGESDKFIVGKTGVKFDGDDNMVPGGAYNFWFNVAKYDGAGTTATSPSIAELMALRGTNLKDDSGTIWSKIEKFSKTLFVDNSSRAYNSDGTAKPIDPSQTRDPNLIGRGTQADPFKTIKNALEFAAELEQLLEDYARANPTKAVDTTVIVRIVAPNNSGDIKKANAYEVGTNTATKATLTDGATFDIPRGVSVVIDAGVIIKMGDVNITVGSPDLNIDRSGASLQVLGTPKKQVYFTSYFDETIGRDTYPLPTKALPGDWGGIVIRNDQDYEFIDKYNASSNRNRREVLENQGIFLNYINNGTFSYGGGSKNDYNYQPIHIIDARPTVTYNTITVSAQAAMSASPNSFEETRYQNWDHLNPFTTDVVRIGPHIHGNALVNNSMNGLLVDVKTPVGTSIVQKVGVAARFDNLDIVHVLSENLVSLVGSPGGNILPTATAPSLNLTSWIQNELGYDRANIFTDTFLDQTLTFVGRKDAFGNYVARPNDAEYFTLTDGETLVTFEYNIVDFIGQGYDNPNRVQAGRVCIDILSTDNERQVAEKTMAAINAVNANEEKLAYVDPRTGQAYPTGMKMYLISNQRLTPNQFKITAGAPESVGRIWTLPLQGTGLRIDIDGVGLIKSRLSGSLIVSPGIVIKSNNSRIELEYGTQLLAEGTVNQPIIFTSLYDNRYGAGGTFNTSSKAAGVSRTSGLPGDWAGITQFPDSNLSLDHVVFAYAGGTSRIEGQLAGFNPIEIREADARIANSRFEFNSGNRHGDYVTDRGGRGMILPSVIFVTGAQPVIVGNDFFENRNFHQDGTERVNCKLSLSVISVNANSLTDQNVVDRGRNTGSIDRYLQYDDNVGPLVRSNTYTNNTLNGMVVRGETLLTESVWDDTDIVHILFNEIVIPNFHTNGGLRLMSDYGNSLIVKLFTDNCVAFGNDRSEAGFTTTGKPLEISDRIGGAMQIVGAPGYPVVLTSLRDDTVGAGFDIRGQVVYDTNNTAWKDANGQWHDSQTPAPGDWRSIKFERYSHDRNVLVIKEFEKDRDIEESNNTPAKAQFLGYLASDMNSGDDLRRLGFEVHGSIRATDPSDADVYSFTANVGTEVWIDITNTGRGLDTIIEILDAEGNILASSDNSFYEGPDQDGNYINRVYDGNPMNRGDGGTTVGFNGGSNAFPLNKDSWQRTTVGVADFEDFTDGVGYNKKYSTNTRDAGLRYVCGPTNTLYGEEKTYYVRVRSVLSISWANSLDPAKHNGKEFYVENTQGQRVTYRLDFNNDKSTVNAQNRLVTIGLKNVNRLNYAATIAEAINTYSYTANRNLSVSASLSRYSLSDDNPVITLTGVGLFFNPLDLKPLQSGMSASGLSAQENSTGYYQLQIRLQETPEIPGCSVAYADIRYAANGIEAYGFPQHSPILGEVQLGNGHTTFETAQNIGNLLQSDRNAISVAGYLASLNDVNWYKFDMELAGLQNIQELYSHRDNDALWSTIFDIDYADALARPDLSIYVFDSAGRLIYMGTDSNIAEDRPGPTGTRPGSYPEGTISKLSAGSVGGNDPFIGPALLQSNVKGNPTKTYFVAVTTKYAVPDAVGSILNVDKGLDNAKTRIEPVDTITRVVEEHVNGGQNFGRNTNDALDNMSALKTDVELAQRLTLTPDEYHLGNIVTYISTDNPGAESAIAMINPFTGAEVLRGNTGRTGSTNNAGFGQDLHLAYDGRLITTHSPNSASFYYNINSQTNYGQNTYSHLTGILPYWLENGGVAFHRTYAWGGFDTTAMTSSRPGAPMQNVSPYWSDWPETNWRGTEAYTIVIGRMPDAMRYNGEIEENVPNPGYITSNENVMYILRSDGVPYKPRIDSTYFSNYMPVQTFQNIDVDTYGAGMRYNMFQEEGEVITAVTFNANATRIFVGTNTGAIYEMCAARYNSDGTIREGSYNGAIRNASGVITGFRSAFMTNEDVDFVFDTGSGPTLTFLGYLLDDNGNVLGTARKKDTMPYDSLYSWSSGGVDVLNAGGGNLTGFALGPQTVEDGIYKNLIFATTDNGKMVAFDPDKLDPSLPKTGAGAVSSSNPIRPTSLLEPVFSGGSRIAPIPFYATGVSFAQIDYNLWHRTGTEADPVLQSPSMIRGNKEFDTSGEQEQRRDNGGSSWYFGLESHNNWDLYSHSVIDTQPNAGWMTAPGAYAGPGAESYQTKFNNNYLDDAGGRMTGSYDMPGGTYGALTSNTFSLVDYVPGDRPTLYYSYKLDVENQSYRNYGDDGLMVFVSTDGNNWERVSSSQFDMSLGLTVGDSYHQDPYNYVDLVSDNQWRQARIDLSRYAGQKNVQLKFVFTTTGGQLGYGQVNHGGSLFTGVAASQLFDTRNGILTLPDQSKSSGFKPGSITSTQLQALLSGNRNALDLRSDSGFVLGNFGNYNSASKTPSNITLATLGSAVVYEYQQGFSLYIPTAPGAQGQAELNDYFVITSATGTTKQIRFGDLVGDDLNLLRKLNTEEFMTRLINRINVVFNGAVTAARYTQHGGAPSALNPYVGQQIYFEGAIDVKVIGNSAGIPLSNSSLRAQQYVVTGGPQDDIIGELSRMSNTALYNWLMAHSRNVSELEGLEAIRTRMNNTVPIPIRGDMTAEEVAGSITFMVNLTMNDDLKAFLAANPSDVYGSAWTTLDAYFNLGGALFNLARSDIKNVSQIFHDEQLIAELILKDGETLDYADTGDVYRVTNGNTVEIPNLIVGNGDVLNGVDIGDRTSVYQYFDVVKDVDLLANEQIQYTNNVIQIRRTIESDDGPSTVITYSNVYTQPGDQIALVRGTYKIGGEDREGYQVRVISRNGSYGNQYAFEFDFENDTISVSLTAVVEHVAANGVTKNTWRPAMNGLIQVDATTWQVSETADRIRVIYSGPADTARTADIIHTANDVMYDHTNGSLSLGNPYAEVMKYLADNTLVTVAGLPRYDLTSLPAGAKIATFPVSYFGLGTNPLERVVACYSDAGYAPIVLNPAEEFAWLRTYSPGDTSLTVYVLGTVSDVLTILRTVTLAVPAADIGNPNIRYDLVRDGNTYTIRKLEVIPGDRFTLVQGETAEVRNFTDVTYVPLRGTTPVTTRHDVTNGSTLKSEKIADWVELNNTTAGKLIDTYLVNIVNPQPWEGLLNWQDILKWNKYGEEWTFSRVTVDGRYEKIISVPSTSINDFSFLGLPLVGSYDPTSLVNLFMVGKQTIERTMQLDVTRNVNTGYNTSGPNPSVYGPGTTSQMTLLGKSVLWYTQQGTLQGFNENAYDYFYGTLPAGLVTKAGGMNVLVSEFESADKAYLGDTWKSRSETESEVYAGYFRKQGDTVRRATDNQHGGIYIDNIIIGAAERGEMVTNAPDDTTGFTYLVDDSPGAEYPYIRGRIPKDTVLQGAYQLEIRRGAENVDYIRPEYNTNPETGRNATPISPIHPNERLTNGLTLVTPNLWEIYHGQKFSLTDGTNKVEFVFFAEHLVRSDSDAVQIVFNQWDTQATLARKIIDAINGAYFAGRFKVTASEYTNPTLIDLFDATDFKNGGLLPIPLSFQDVTGKLVTIPRDLAGNVNKASSEYRLWLTTQDYQNWLFRNGENGRPIKHIFYGQQYFTPVFEYNGETAMPGLDYGDDQVMSSTIKVFVDDRAQSGLTYWKPELDLFWNSVSGATSYVVERSTSAIGPWTQMYSGPELSFADNSVASVTKYYYRVKAVNATGDSNWAMLYSIKLTNALDHERMPVAPVGDRGGLPMTISQLTSNFLAFTDPTQIQYSRMYIDRNTMFGDRIGDENLKREKGQLNIFASFITDSREYGLRLEPGRREMDIDGGPTHPGGVMNQQNAAILRDPRTQDTTQATQNGGVTNFVPGIAVMNNVFAYNLLGGIYLCGQRSGWKLIAELDEEGKPVLDDDGNPVFREEYQFDNDDPQGPVPFVRIVNNTFYGDAAGTGTGIVVGPHASPTIMNNIFANLAAGVEIDSNSRSTVLLANAYQNNATNLVNGTINPAFDKVLGPNDPLFVAPEARNFYLRQGSKAIDTGIASLQERESWYGSYISALGIPRSAIQAPVTDIYGQTRKADESTTSGGTGANAWVDMGAVDRVDIYNPISYLINPQDRMRPEDIGDDLNSEPHNVFLVDKKLINFVIQLSDDGIGIDNLSVADPRGKIHANIVTILEQTWNVETQEAIVKELELDKDYFADYNASNNQIFLTPTRGRWNSNATYTILLNNSSVDGIRDLAGNPLNLNRPDGQVRFEVVLGGYDYGDAEGYPTLFNPSNPNAYARHIVWNGYSLGAGVGVETDARTSPHIMNPDGTQQHGNKYDDGVTGNVLVPGQYVEFTFDVTATSIPTDFLEKNPADYAAGYVGYVNAFFDWQRSGNWSDADNRVQWMDSNGAPQTGPIPVKAGSNTVKIFVPSTFRDSAGRQQDLKDGEVWARFRFSSEKNLGPTGPGPDGKEVFGEVEDYKFIVALHPKGFGSAPQGEFKDPLTGEPRTYDYPVTLEKNGARHATDMKYGYKNGTAEKYNASDDESLFVNGGALYFGTEAPRPTANAYPGIPGPTQDGVNLQNTIFIAGQTAKVDVRIHVPAALKDYLKDHPFERIYVEAWFDFHNNGTWDNTTATTYAWKELSYADLVKLEQVDSLYTVSLSVKVPNGATKAASFARFRVNSERQLGATGYVGPNDDLPIDGEVQDVMIFVLPYAMDWQTDFDTTSYGTAVHKIMNGSDGNVIKLGKLNHVDFGPEFPKAVSGLVDDNDGVIFRSLLVDGVIENTLLGDGVTEITVTASHKGYVSIWIDLPDIRNGFADLTSKGYYDEITDRMKDANGNVYFAVEPGVNKINLELGTGITGKLEKLETQFRIRYTDETVNHNMLRATNTLENIVANGEVEDYQVILLGATCSISGTVWNDYNKNGVRDRNEPGMNNVLIGLFTEEDWPAYEGGVENIVPTYTATTNINGKYAFTGLQPGIYYVAQSSVGGRWVQTFPTKEKDGRDYHYVELWESEELGASESYDFGNFQPGQVTLGGVEIVGDNMVVEGNAGYTTVRVPVYLWDSFGANVTVEVEAFDGTALAGIDYRVPTGGTTSYTFDENSIRSQGWDVRSISSDLGETGQYDSSVSGPVVAYAAKIGNNYQVMLESLDDPNGVFVLTNSTRDSIDPQVYFDNNTVYVVWSSFNGKTYDLYYAWGDARNLKSLQNNIVKLKNDLDWVPQGVNNLSPRVSKEGNDVHVAWLAQYPENYADREYAGKSYIMTQKVDPSDLANGVPGKAIMTQDGKNTVAYFANVTDLHLDGSTVAWTTTRQVTVYDMTQDPYDYYYSPYKTITLTDVFVSTISKGKGRQQAQQISEEHNIRSFTYGNTVYNFVDDINKLVLNQNLKINNGIAVWELQSGTGERFSQRIAVYNVAEEKFLAIGQQDKYLTSPDVSGKWVVWQAETKTQNPSRPGTTTSTYDIWALNIEEFGKNDGWKNYRNGTQLLESYTVDRESLEYENDNLPSFMVSRPEDLYEGSALWNITRDISVTFANEDLFAEFLTNVNSGDLFNLRIPRTPADLDKALPDKQDLQIRFNGENGPQVTVSTTRSVPEIGEDGLPVIDEETGEIKMVLELITSEELAFRVVQAVNEFFMFVPGNRIHAFIRIVGSQYVISFRNATSVEVVDNDAFPPVDSFDRDPNFSVKYGANVKEATVLGRITKDLILNVGNIENLVFDGPINAALTITSRIANDNPILPPTSPLQCVTFNEVIGNLGNVTIEAQNLQTVFVNKGIDVDGKLTVRTNHLTNLVTDGVISGSLYIMPASGSSQYAVTLDQFINYGDIRAAARFNNEYNLGAWGFDTFVNFGIVRSVDLFRGTSVNSIVVYTTDDYWRIAKLLEDAGGNTSATFSLVYGTYFMEVSARYYDHNGNNVTPRVCGDRVVWRYSDPASYATGDQWYVYAIDLSDLVPRQTQVSQSNHSAWSPQVSEDRVVWRAQVGGSGYQVFSAAFQPNYLMGYVTFQVIGNTIIEPDKWFGVKIVDAWLEDDYGNRVDDIPKENIIGENNTGYVWILNDDGNMNFGTLPNSYSTLLAQDGARHGVTSSRPLALFDPKREGIDIYVRKDGQPNDKATSPTGDKQGVVFGKYENDRIVESPWIPGQTTTITVTVTEDCYLNAFIDWNGNGRFGTRDFSADPNDPSKFAKYDRDERLEYLFDLTDAQKKDPVFMAKLKAKGYKLTAGVNVITFTVPQHAKAGTTGARFRVSSQGSLNYFGYASDGEVEDYMVKIQSIDKTPVWRTGNEVIVSGSVLRDELIVNYNDAKYGGQLSIQLNGVAYTTSGAGGSKKLDMAGIKEIKFDGFYGADAVTIYGNASHSYDVEMNSTGVSTIIDEQMNLTISLVNAPNITFNGGSFPGNSAAMNDSGVCTLTMRPNEAVMSGVSYNTHTGAMQDYTYSVLKVETVVATTESWGSTVFLYGSTDDGEEFRRMGNGGVALKGKNFTNTADGFGDVRAFNLGGKNNKAYIDVSDARNEVNFRRGSQSLYNVLDVNVGNGAQMIRVYGFDSHTVTANPMSSSTASIIGTPKNEYLYAGKNQVKLFDWGKNLDPMNPATDDAILELLAYNSVKAKGNGGTDKAVIHLDALASIILEDTWI